MNAFIAWPTEPERLSLADDEVHVWLAQLDEWESSADSFLPLLAADERDRAERYVFRKHRLRFILTRGILRTLLGRYLQQPPERLSFDYSYYGKPSLAGEQKLSPLRFNVSHAHHLALYAFTFKRELGLDLEHVRADFAGEEIAERFFSAREVAGLRGLAPEERAAAFFNCWTRKEAYIKARGEGLSFPLDQFVVSLAPGEPAALLEVRGSPSECERWTLRELSPGAEYAAAVAVEGRDWRLRCWRWTG
jgi:4'-phosphopantetheinyl transferase